ncbi:hypothetical protein EYF80_057732 [Liparis tanakae]|uniref:Uncharacterized protein n=1 Tax=Liparis tanakae TaxID=230148 RepID=A0A4Z2ET56_9TELE|nr:hypothetical protein EYF80_057732 [Liparis tanakae]
MGTWRGPGKEGGREGERESVIGLTPYLHRSPPPPSTTTTSTPSHRPKLNWTLELFVILNAVERDTVIGCVLIRQTRAPEVGVCVRVKASWLGVEEREEESSEVTGSFCGALPSLLPREAAA